MKSLMDIPQFTETPTYKTDISLDYFIDYFKRLEINHNLVHNPDFQRGHVWTKEQQISYVEFILRGGTTGKAIYLNQAGWMADFKGEMVVVDGLQRITALGVFLRGELPVFGNLISDYSDLHALRRVDLQIYINNLNTRKKVLIWYLEMNSSGTPHSREELDKVKLMLGKE